MVVRRVIVVFSLMTGATMASTKPPSAIMTVTTPPFRHVITSHNAEFCSGVQTFAPS